MAFHVGEGGVVEPPRVAEVRKLLVVTPLLPVEPPKVYAHLVEESQLGIEPSLHESLARGLPRYVLLRGGVHAHVACHGGIVFLKVLYAVGGMEVKGDLKVLAFEPIQEFVGARKEPSVEGIARSAAFFGLGIVPVPVDDQPVERDVVGVEAVAERDRKRVV